MKNKIALAVLALCVLSQAGLSAFADEPATAGGPLTRSGNTIWKVASFPMRFACGAGGMMIGAGMGGGKGVMRTEKEFYANTFAQADKNPALYPVGVLGSLIAVPVGFVTGMPEGAATGGAYGFKLLDHI